MGPSITKLLQSSTPRTLYDILYQSGIIYGGAKKKKKCLYAQDEKKIAARGKKKKTGKALQHVSYNVNKNSQWEGDGSMLFRILFWFTFI